jgi:phospholipid/cholesterol/gamma-HCH transport system substrate-binding protein
MNFKFKHTEKIVGVFIFTAIVILIAGIITIAVYQKLFIKGFTFKTKLSSAEGLSTSTIISFRGYEIGKIRNYLLDEDNNIDAEIFIYKDFREKIVKGCAIYRQVSPISGKTWLILLYPNQLPLRITKNGTTLSVLLPEGSYLPSLDMYDGKKLLEDKIIEKYGDSIAILFEDARDFVSNLRQEVRLKQDSFQDFFKNLAEFANSLARNSKILDNITLMTDPNKGPVFSTLNQFVDISKKLNESVNQLNSLIENYKKPDGIIPKMMQIKPEEIDKTMQNLNKNLETLYQMIKSLQEQVPMIAEVLMNTDKTLQGLNNNPLLRGGIPKENKNTNSSKKKRLDMDNENNKINNNKEKK